MPLESHTPRQQRHIHVHALSGVLLASAGLLSDAVRRCASSPPLSRLDRESQQRRNQADFVHRQLQDHSLQPPPPGQQGPRPALPQDHGLRVRAVVAAVRGPSECLSDASPSERAVRAVEGAAVPVHHRAVRAGRAVIREERNSLDDQEVLRTAHLLFARSVRDPPRIRTGRAHARRVSLRVLSPFRGLRVGEGVLRGVRDSGECCKRE